MTTGHRHERELPFALGLITFAGAVSITPAVSHWLDSPEFIGAAVGLGLVHPPGHPLATLLGKAATLIPLGSLPFRVALLSSTALAVAIATAASIGRRLVDRAHWLIPALLLCAFSGSALLQGVRAEVYALNTALVLAVLAELLQKPSPRGWARAGLWLGLALANHHYLTVLGLLGPGLVVFAQRPRVQLLAIGATSTMIGLATYLLLPLRALADPLVFWGDPRQWSRFVWMISAQVFSRSLEHPGESGVPGNLMAAFFEQMDAIGPVAGLLSLLGMALLIRERRSRGLMIAGAFLGCLLSKSLMGFDRFNPDLHGYFLTAYVLGALVVALPLQRLTALPRSLEAVAWAFITVLAVARFGSGGPGLPDGEREDARNVASIALGALPPHAIAMTADFKDIFLLWGIASSDGARPDVTLLHRPFLAFPGYSDHLLRTHPDLVTLLRGPNGLEPGSCPRAHPRPVRVAPDLDLREDCKAGLATTGLWARASDAPSSNVGGVWARLEAAVDLNDRQSHRWLLWKHYLHAHQRAARGNVRALGFHLQQAERLSPGAPELAKLRALLRGVRRTTPPEKGRPLALP